ncbi:MFS transporter [Thalassobaculum fulvum]|uniref:MFS transporter n=2 Tax=Thalassobaculum fulvum TaxID=1633335 RepID=A0A919CRC0_9PROT|nr:MFS transporter [Thalassobaculum fulvum]
MRGMPVWLSALGAALLMQTSAAFLTRVFPVMGPALTDAVGVAPERIGILASVTSFGTMVYLIAGGDLLPRLGAVRTLQVGVCIGTAGLLAALLGAWEALIFAAFLIGVGYGPSPPAGSDILNRHAPPGRRSLVFSIKQSGVPLGGAVAGVLMPALLVWADWRTACAIAAAAALATIAFVQPVRAAIDAERDRHHPLRLSEALRPRSLLRPFRAVAEGPVMLATTYAGFCFALVQGCLFAFYVTFLATGLGLSLPLAGLAFAVMQGVGVVGRVAVGWIADSVGSARATLVALAVASSAATLAVAGMSDGWPVWAIVGLAGVSGFASASWNGVYLSEIAAAAPAGMVGHATAGSTFLTFIGYVVGPVVFGAAVTAAGGYQAAFAVTAAAPLTGAASLLYAMRRTRET